MAGDTYQYVAEDLACRSATGIEGKAVIFHSTRRYCRAQDAHGCWKGDCTSLLCGLAQVSCTYSDEKTLPSDNAQAVF